MPPRTSNHEKVLNVTRNQVVPNKKQNAFSHHIIIINYAATNIYVHVFSAHVRAILLGTMGSQGL